MTGIILPPAVAADLGPRFGQGLAPDTRTEVCG